MSGYDCSFQISRINVSELTSHMMVDRVTSIQVEVRDSQMWGILASGGSPTPLPPLSQRKGRRGAAAGSCWKLLRQTLQVDTL